MYYTTVFPDCQYLIIKVFQVFLKTEVENTVEIAIYKCGFPYGVVVNTDIVVITVSVVITDIVTTVIIVTDIVTTVIVITVIVTTVVITTIVVTTVIIIIYIIYIGGV